MLNIYCRAFQAAVKCANYFLPYSVPECIEGPGCVKQIPDVIKQRGIDRVLLVTGPNIVRLGLTNGLLTAMEAAGISCTVFSSISGDPTNDDVESGYASYRDNECQAIVAFGGGGPMDCAKAIGARAACPRKKVEQLQGVLKVRRRLPPLFAVPTTSGTGSETTLASVITDSSTHHKASISDPALIPCCAALDPELTLPLPPFVTAITGMDALCHAVEAYTNHTYNTRTENKMAVEAVKLIHGSLLKAYRDGRDLEARQNMQRASFYAGRAFTRGCVGYVHAVGHTLGGLYGVPHGLAMALLLPHVMRQFGSAVFKHLAELADACGIEGTTEEEKALRFIEWIEQLKLEMGLPDKTDIIKDEDVQKIVAWAMKEANPLYPVPVVWQKDDFLSLLRRIRKDASAELS